MVDVRVEQVGYNSLDVCPMLAQHSPKLPKSKVSFVCGEFTIIVCFIEYQASVEAKTFDWPVV